MPAASTTPGTGCQEAPDDAPEHTGDRTSTFTAWLSPQLAELAPTRRRMRRWLEGHLVADTVITDVVLIMSELATNAVRAARHRVRVQVGHTGTDVTVEVRDDGPGLPSITAARFAARTPNHDKGHGLFLVSALSDDVFVAADESGTLIRAWCRTAVRPTKQTSAAAACTPGSGATPGTPASG